MSGRREHSFGGSWSPQGESLLQLPPESKLEVDDILEDWIGTARSLKGTFSSVGVLSVPDSL